MGQVWAGPAGGDTFEKQLPNCTTTCSGILIPFPKPPKSSARKKQKRMDHWITGSMGRFLSAPPTATSFLLFPARGNLTSAQKHLWKWVGGSLTPVSAREESALCRVLSCSISCDERKKRSESATDLLETRVTSSGSGHSNP